MMHSNLQNQFCNSRIQSLELVIDYSLLEMRPPWDIFRMSILYTKQGFTPFTITIFMITQQHVSLIQK